MGAYIEVIEDRIPLLLERLPDATYELQKEAAERLREILQQLAPVGSGPEHDQRVKDEQDFKGGIKVDDGGPDDLLVAFTAPHSWYVLFGTGRMAARPIHIEGQQQLQPWYLNEVGRLMQRAGLG